MQTRDLLQFAEARGWQLADEYVDREVSGTKESRPELNRLMADAKRRKFDVVLVWKAGPPRALTAAFGQRAS